MKHPRGASGPGHRPVHPPPAATRTLGACGAALGLVGAAAAGLELDFVTTRGTITAELDYERAPMAAANLVTLAEGTRNWVDPTTGAVRDTPFFSGLTFHRVINEPGVKLIETGSRSGDGEDGPGYRFPDEFDPGLAHAPYVVAMAGGDPNTNGSRLYFTGNATMSERDGVYSVFGTVPGAASRSVIDQILAAGPGATAVTHVEVRRIGMEDAGFDEHQAGLPTVRSLAPALRVVPGVSTRMQWPQVAISEILVHASPDLASWTSHYRRFVGADDPPPGTHQLVDGAELLSRFYRFALVEYSAGGGPGSFANRTLVIETPQTDTLIYSFDATGLAGTYENVVFGTTFYEGQFEVRHERPAWYGPHSFAVLLRLFDPELGGSPFNHIRGGFDEVSTTQLSGRHATTFLDGSLRHVFEDRGVMTLTRSQ